MTAMRPAGVNALAVPHAQWERVASIVFSCRGDQAMVAVLRETLMTLTVTHQTLVSAWLAVDLYGERCNQYPYEA